ncbi:hypothetical protein MTR67_026865 [Solanum verrucosum]|uniref:Uncharacterized protein n=1 Tax=Solanum verrucosum TaxID=315347 RepID=A0AAF0R6C7_SOLVR|nr:hypothetical protein MTR67_026865 [Solanum verrucosum]
MLYIHASLFDSIWEWNNFSKCRVNVHVHHIISCRLKQATIILL